MAEIVNLRQARKAKARAEREEVAARNRAIHGRPKAERELERKKAETAITRLDAHKRERD
jgi:hypothetical protein